ncbi:hypothetical protein A2U01_0093147, partial [Trifolium medium]|nr:hypothetical protein [Trifolium medium]
TQPPSASTGGSQGATPDAVAFMVGKISILVDLFKSPKCDISARDGYPIHYQQDIRNRLWEGDRG